MNRLNYVKKHVIKMLNYLETHEGLTEQEKCLYGYNPSVWGSRECFDAYLARKYIAYDNYNRNQITKTMLKDMKNFLDEAEKYGFVGDIWFKTGYSDGMYASTRTGNDYRGDLVLYHTFNSDENKWKIYKGRRFSYKDERTKDKYITTKNQLKSFIKENNI